ncbi:unnamed protein product [Prorocentrum cordatum]|uniref:Uncharacterized protein n=1 Tax=Prorocentrum cordatum TaxID=2364126 RepID=A0ABN9THA4_9DINO|nr:unnamed protein product [Polarella glacialis]
MFKPIGEVQVTAGSNESKRTAAEAGVVGDQPDVVGPLAKALARLVLQHEDMARSARRGDNFVIPLKPTQKMATALDQALAYYEEEGAKAKAKAKEKQEEFMGNPLGKRPDALARAVLFRMSEAVEDKKDAVLAAVEPGIEPQVAMAALDELLKVGKMVQDPLMKFVATRCFKVKSKNDEEGLETGGCKWIFAVNHYQGLKESLNLLRRNGSLAAVGVGLQCDIATRSKAAKEVESLALKGGKGTQASRSNKLRKK